LNSNRLLNTNAKTLPLLRHMKYIERVIRQRYMWLLLLALSCIGCNHDDVYSTDSRYKLSFSMDTISFDTVFSTVGSATTRMCIYNRNNVPLQFDVVMASGNGPFRVNVDGQSGYLFDDLVLDANDSMYVFATVTIDPTNNKNPLQFSDSLIVNLKSGVIQKVILSAYGQDAKILRGRVISRDTVFSAELPIIVYDSLFVDTNATLTLSAGTRLYFHKGAGLKVAGCLVARGTADSIVVMRGDRTDRLFSYLPYDLISGQWEGVRFLSSSFGNELSYCDIHGANYGIVVDTSVTEKKKLTIRSSVIHNMSGNVLELNNCFSEVFNSQITNGGGNCISILGGDNSFIFCTIANFFPWGISDVAVLLRNSDNDISYPLKSAVFKNCIITGNHENEIVDLLSDSAEYAVGYSLIRQKDTINQRYTNVVYDDTSISDNFRHISRTDYRFDFRLDSLSLARGIADIDDKNLFPSDLLNVSRLEQDKADAGCYRYTDY
jgi:hypothetical protein